MPVREEVRGDGADTALARALQQTGGVAIDALGRGLDELRARREREPGLCLAALLLERGLADAGALERARALLSAGAAPAPQDDPARRGRSPERFGPYRVVRELARGGMGLVLEVEHEVTGARYALKSVLSQNDPDGLLRFRREAEVLARLDHPHIVRVHAADLEARPPWFVVALLTGGTLARRMRDGGPLSPEEAVPLVATLARAVAHAHERGVLHRDLKPENVLFDDQGAPCVVDFGLARDADAGGCRLTLTGEVMGTPSFMAPEQALGAVADPRTDVWGLGAILFAALTGRPPFEGQSPFAVLEQVIRQDPIAPGRLRPGIPRALDALALRALAREREARFSSAAELAAALEALAGASPAAARSPTWLAPLAAAAAVSIAVAAVAVFAVRPGPVAPAPSRSTESAYALPVTTDAKSELPAWVRDATPRVDLAERARTAPLAEVEAALARLEREPRGPLEPLRLAARLRAARTDLRLVDEAHGRALFERWLDEARSARADAASELSLVDSGYWSSEPVRDLPVLARLERLSEAIGAALLLGRWNPYDEEEGLADPLVGLSILTGRDTAASVRTVLREQLDVRAPRTSEPLFVAAWLHSEGKEQNIPTSPEFLRRSAAGFLALERLVAVMPAGPPSKRWRQTHGELVGLLRWRGRGQFPEFVLAEAARAQAGSRALWLAAEHHLVEVQRGAAGEALSSVRRCWDLLERIPEDERDPSSDLRARRSIEALALLEAPAWFVDLPPEQRPPAFLPEGLRFGERPGTYVRASDGAVLEWVDGSFRVAR